MKLDKVVSVITLRDVVREVVVFGVCFLVAFALSIYAVVHFQTDWKELYTDIGYTVVLATVIYVARCIFKCLAIVVCKIIQNSKLTRHKVGFSSFAPRQFK